MPRSSLRCEEKKRKKRKKTRLAGKATPFPRVCRRRSSATQFSQRIVLSGRDRAQNDNRGRCEKHQEMGEPQAAREQRQRRRQAPHRAAVRSARLEDHHAVLATAHAQHTENPAHAADQEVQLGSHRALHRGAAAVHHHGE